MSVLDMLTYCRPAGSPTESEFIKRWIAPLPGACQDAGGNWHVRIGDSRILWSCHTDTVHWKAGRQTVRYNPKTSIVMLSKRALRDGRNCLGADDTAGMWLCVQMILRSIPGHYVFHFGEEIGCQGSRWIAVDAPELITDSEIAIAFDRRGSGDIITSQFGGRCASDEFAQSLSMELAKSGLTYSPARGVYTDTAEYTAIIPECSNLSVGYGGEHTSREFLHIGHLRRVLDAVCRLDQSALVVSRVPDDDWHDTDYFDMTIAGSHLDPIIDESGRPINYTDCDLCGGLMVDERCQDCGHVEDDNSLYLDQFHAEIQAMCRRQPLPFRLKLRG